MSRHRPGIVRIAGLSIGAALCLPLAVAAQDDVAPGECGPPVVGVKCSPGNGRVNPGGPGLVARNDGAGRQRPRVTGIFWQVVDLTGRQKLGGTLNDELLGHHGSDRLSGAGGDDVLWGDWDPKHNTTKQRDYLSGGSGDDWIYPSHGRNTLLGGPGVDYVFAYYGHGTIDCGPGKDTARVRIGTGQYRVKNCEKIKHFCAFGENSTGGCKKPGERAERLRTG
jgi:hypothetical protein